MATRKFNVKWANGKAFQIFNLKSQIEVDENGTLVSVTFNQTNQDPTTPVSVPAKSDGCIIELDLSQFLPPGYEGVMVEWKRDPASKRMLFGEVFFGDPDGAGGFGGEQDPGG